jgi:hypothetical protein
VQAKQSIDQQIEEFSRTIALLHFTLSTSEKKDSTPNTSRSTQTEIHLPVSLI